MEGLTLVWETISKIVGLQGLKGSNPLPSSKHELIWCRDCPHDVYHHTKDDGRFMGCDLCDCVDYHD